MAVRPGAGAEVLREAVALVAVERAAAVTEPLESAAA